MLGMLDGDNGVMMLGTSRGHFWGCGHQMGTMMSSGHGDNDVPSPCWRDRWTPTGACPRELGMLVGDSGVPRTGGCHQGPMMSLGAGHIEGGGTVPRGWGHQRGQMDVQGCWRGGNVSPKIGDIREGDLGMAEGTVVIPGAGDTWRRRTVTPKGDIRGEM